MLLQEAHPRAPLFHGGLVKAISFTAIALVILIRPPSVAVILGTAVKMAHSLVLSKLEAAIAVCNPIKHTPTPIAVCIRIKPTPDPKP